MGHKPVIPTFTSAASTVSTVGMWSSGNGQWHYMTGDIIKDIATLRAVAYASASELHQLKKKRTPDLDREFALVDSIRWLDMRGYVSDVVGALEAKKKVPVGTVKWLLAMIDLSVT